MIRIWHYWSGTVTIVFFALLNFGSVSFIRRRYYEAFKYFHILFALFFMGFLFYHTSNLSRSFDFLIPTAAIYGVAIVCRFGWMLYTNSSGVPRASFEIKPAGMVKLKVKCNPLERWAPGQHYFFHFGFGSVMPFQS